MTPKPLGLRLSRIMFVSSAVEPFIIGLDHPPQRFRSSNINLILCIIVAASLSLPVCVDFQLHEGSSVVVCGHYTQTNAMCKGLTKENYSVKWMAGRSYT